MTSDTSHDAALILRLSRENEALRDQLAARDSQIAAVDTALDSLSIQWHDPMASPDPGVAWKARELAMMINAFPLRLTSTHYELRGRLWEVSVSSGHGVSETGFNLYVIAPTQERTEAWVKETNPNGWPSFYTVTVRAAHPRAEPICWAP